MHIDVIEGSDELAGLERDWRAVYDADPEAHYFVSWPWMSCWLKSAIKDWVVLAARPDGDDTRHVAFLALRPIVRFKRGTGLINQLVVACHGMSIYTGLVCDPAAEGDALPALARRLQEMQWASLELENFDMSDRRFALFETAFPVKTVKTTRLARFENAGGKDMGRCPAIDLPDDWETYLASAVGANTRQKIRRFLRKTDAGEEFRITHADADSFARDLDILLDLWGAMWDEEKGAEAQEIKKVNRLMLTSCFEAGALYLPVMWLGERPLGALAIVVDQVKRSYLFKITGRDENFTGPPPGFILHAHAIRHAIANGMRRYDFLPGNDSYKYLFGATDRRVRNVAIETKNGRNLNTTLDPRTLGRAVAMADRLRQTGKTAEAERAYRQILATDPGAQQAVLGLVNLLESKGDRKGAKRLMSSLLAKD